MIQEWKQRKPKDSKQVNKMENKSNSRPDQWNKSWFLEGKKALTNL